MTTLSFIVQGNLSNELTYTLPNFQELSRGLWTISVISVSYQSNEAISTLCSLSCNLSQALKYTTNSQKLQVQQPFGIFEIQTSQEVSSRLVQTSKYSFILAKINLNQN